MPISKTRLIKNTSFQKSPRAAQTTAAQPRSVIYCRVSSTKQMTEGDGLASQENNCRNYASARGYTICAVFRDGISGGTDNRRGLQQMLDFLKSQGEGMVVIIDDLKRFAREVEMHFDLKRIITDCGARLESPLFRFEDTPEGKFMETIVAAQAELERNQNKRQVVSRMKARLEMGYWVFKAPPGYTFERHPIAKKLLVPNELAPLVSQALEGYASARFGRVSDVAHFLEEHGFFQEGSKAQGTRHGRVQDMLESVLYSGWIEYPAWGVTLREGRHEPLISLTSYRKIQERLHGKDTGTSDLPRRHEFSLRGVVRCADCGYPMTASFSRGCSGKNYCYYNCWKQGCSQRGKSIPAKELETAIEEQLAQLTMTSESFDAAVDWLVQQELASGQRRHETLSRVGTQIAVLARQEEDLIASISRTQVAQVQQALEAKLISLLDDKALLEDQRRQLRSESGGDAGESVRTMVEEVGMYLRNPLQAWQTGDTKKRQLVARVAFPQSVYYERGKGLRTPNYRLCYRIFRGVVGEKSDVVDLDPIGSELDELSSPTATFSPHCSDCLLYDQVMEELRFLSLIVRDYAAEQERNPGQAQPFASSPQEAELVAPV